MDELVLVLVGCLSAATIFSAVEYYRYVRRAKIEYEKAKEAVEDIVLSFNRQFKREAERLESLAYKVEAVASKAGSAVNSVEDVVKRVSNLETRTGADIAAREKVVARLNEVENKIRDTLTSQETVATKVANLEQQAKQLPAVPEAGLEAVIPIRREKAMAQLTDTEISVLEMLSSQGPKTAPETKERVKLSREHTARLMKKLYEEGYLERETSKIPFKYSVKKEMEKLLKKAESQAG